MSLSLRAARRAFRRFIADTVVARVSVYPLARRAPVR